MSVLIPVRQRGFEILDNPALNPALAVRSLRDVALANRLFGGTRAILMEFRTVMAEARAQGITHLSVLDVGTGLADIPLAISRIAARAGFSVRVTSVEMIKALAAVGRARVHHAVTADARCLPFANRSVDVITCSQLLHHFHDEDARYLLSECERVARRRVIVADLRRSWLSIGLFWLVSFPLGFHPVSRHDGVASIRRGFTLEELRAIVQHSIGTVPEVHHRAGWRVTATWFPGRKSL